MRPLVWEVLFDNLLWVARGANAVRADYSVLLLFHLKPPQFAVQARANDGSGHETLGAAPTLEEAMAACEQHWAQKEAERDTPA